LIKPKKVQEEKEVIKRDGLLTCIAGSNEVFGNAASGMKSCSYFGGKSYSFRSFFPITATQNSML